MPRGDGSGPMGQGPMTGWGYGYCAGGDRPGSARLGNGGRGMRMRTNRRARPFRGNRFMQFSGMPDANGTNDQIGQLEEETRSLRQQLERMQSRIEELFRKS